MRRRRAAEAPPITSRSKRRSPSFIRFSVQSGVDDLIIFTDMADYLPPFKRLMDTSTADDMDLLAARYTGSINMQKSLKLLQPAFDQEKL